MQASERVALLTGSARRLGAHVARHLHGRGLRLVLHYRKASQEASALAAELEAARPGSTALVAADLLDPATPQRLVRAAHEAFGRLDFVINNASSFYPTPFREAGPDAWQDLMTTNLQAPFFLIQAAASVLAEHRGAVVNLVDINAERPLPGYPIYSIAKAGLVMLTKSLARELAPDVRVNAIAPGAILWAEGTPETAKERAIARIPLKRRGEPEDIARAVAFLLLDAPYITGQVLTVDGGRSVVA